MKTMASFATKQRRRRRPTSFRPVVGITAATAFTFSLVLAGCGGGGGLPGALTNPGTPTENGGSGGTGTQTPQGRGTVSLTITWPPLPTGTTGKSRLIPATAQSIRVTISDAAGKTLAEKLVTRPAAGQNTSRVQLTGVAAGPATVTATAYPDAEAKGVAQATGSAPVTVASGQTVTVNLTMGTTIADVQISPAGPTLAVGVQSVLIASARDASGAIVLTDPARWTWKVDKPAVAQIVPSADKATVTTLATGTATVTVTETETGKTGQTTITVTDKADAGQTPVGLIASAWAKLRGNARNNGRSTGAANQNAGRQQWKFSAAGDNISSSPILAPGDAALYVGTFGGQIIALDTKNGKALWRYDTQASVGPGVSATPALAADGTLYVATGDGRLLALATRAGGPPTLRWQIPTGRLGIVFGAPTLAPNGTLYVFARNPAGNAGDLLHALNGATGALKWTFQTANTSGYISSSAPALGSDNTVYVGASDQRLYAVDGATGKKRWEFALGNRIEVAAPALGDDGTVFLPPADSVAYGVNGATGQKRWEFRLSRGRSTTASCAVTQNNTVIFGADDGNVYGLNGADGQKRWQVAGPNDGSTVTYSAPSIGSDGGAVIALLRRGGSGAAGANTLVFALDAAGKKRWEQDLGATDPTLFLNPLEPVIGSDGAVYAVSADTVSALR